MFPNDDPWITEYWVIDFSSEFGSIYKVDVPSGNYEILKSKGFRTYTFQSQRDYSTTHILVKTHDECAKFAGKVYDDIKSGKWKIRNIPLPQYGRIRELVADKPKKSVPASNQPTLF